ncbi:hypothetical protein BJ165DRAFT_1354396 [Panaeolus papilionaceus]|nr:hypothetical protein BJ165DRAFT_1354396 [Panaeolus papilionaceus]
MDQVVEHYLLELEKPEAERKGTRVVAAEVSEEHFQKTRRQVKISHQTVNERAKGHQSKKEVAAKHCWMTDAEVDMAVNYCLQCAKQGFPLSYLRLKQFIDHLLQKRLGDEFPASGVGK